MKHSVSIISLMISTLFCSAWAQNPTPASTSSSTPAPTATPTPLPSMPVRQTQSLETQAVDDREAARFNRTAPALQERLREHHKERYPSANSPSHLTAPSHVPVLPVPKVLTPESDTGVKTYP